MIYMINFKKIYGTYSDQKKTKENWRKKVFEAEGDDKLQSQSLRASGERGKKSQSTWH